MELYPYEILETKEAVLADNDAEAENNRQLLREKKVFLVNLMSSPGSGKTTTLLRTIRALNCRYRIGVMEADVDGDIDAAAVASLGIPVIQLHTGGSCHMDASMTRRGLERMDLDSLDVVFLENVGNLVCPAEFDVGAALRVMILSVPEGDDKPLKYPLMFSVSDAMLINKTDVAPVFDFDTQACAERAKALNPNIRIFPMSALTGDEFPVWAQWLEDEIEKWRKTQ
jgi:hydrogenase nickel incorporation protein HypB